MASVDFALDQSGDKPVIPAGTDADDLFILPNLPGSKTIPDLQTAMYFDPTLKAMVEDLVYGDHDFQTFIAFAGGGPQLFGDAASFEGRFLDVLYRWVGVDTSVPADADHPF
jgi:hypothetical protein